MILLIACASCALPHAGAQRPRVVPPPGDAPAQPPVPPAPVVIPKAPATPPEEPVDIKPLIAVVEAQNLAIRKRITHRFRDGRWTPHLMAAGAKGMDLLATADHETGSYTRNPDLWTQDLTAQLTGLVIHNSHSVQSYGGVLITPRHLLFCAHAHPHAEGTWPPNPKQPSAVHRFLTNDGRLVEATQLHQAKSHGGGVVEGLESVDLCVALLDRDLEAEGLHVVPVFPAVSNAGHTALMSWARENREPFPFIGASQGVGRRTNSQPPEPIADYPREHGKMIYIKDQLDPSNTRADPGPFAKWNFRVWDGDSGTPSFLLLNERLHLWMILTSAPGGGPRVGSHIDHVNTLIGLADAKAVEAGRLDAPTGHSLRVGSLD